MTIIPTPPPAKLLLKEPTPPEPHECCESGCGEYCVFELYLDEKRAYDEQQKRLNELQNDNA